MLSRFLLVGTAFAVLGATPAYGAAEVSPLKRCYIAARENEREYVSVEARGFAPLATVDIYVDDILQPAAPEPRASFTGELSGMVQAPFVESGQREFSLRLTERGAPANTVSATARVTRLSVEQVPERAATRERVRFRGRGFTAAAPVYAHYVFAGRSRRTVRIGMPYGACGLFSVKRRQFPFRRAPRVGVWTIQFDQQKRYDPRAGVRFPLTVKVRRTIRPRQAPSRLSR
jgi:hypothetical protein